MSPDDASLFIGAGDNVGMSGFTGAGYPKEVPAALVRRVAEAAARGDRLAVSVWTGASTAPELDGALASVDAINLRMPYQSDPVSRAKINAGLLDYLDMHLSHVAQMVWEGAFGHLDVALIEVTGVTQMPVTFAPLATDDGSTALMTSLAPMVMLVVPVASSV